MPPAPIRMREMHVAMIILTAAALAAGPGPNPPPRKDLADMEGPTVKRFLAASWISRSMLTSEV
jgi:hypothetical protein